MTTSVDTGVPGSGGRAAVSTATVAVAQFAPVHGDVPANLATIRSLLEQAASRGADLVVFPELATTGYAWASTDEVGPLAEPVPGPVTDQLTAWCRELGTHLVIGLAERADEVLYNSAVLIGPQGLAGCYRKTHLWSWDTLWATAGAEPPAVWPTPAGQVGMLICADLDYPEGTTWLARAGAELIAVPVCWSDEPTPSPVWRARARDSGVPFAVANISSTEWGTAFSAGSCVIDGDGALLGRATEPQELTVATVDLTAGRRRRATQAAAAPAAPPGAFEALHRNQQLFPRAELPGLSARPRPAEPARMAVVQGRGDGPAEAALTALALRLGAISPVTVAVLPTLLAPDLAADPGLPARLAALCDRHGSAEFVVSVLDERSGQTTVLLAADGTIVTSVTVSPDGLRTGDAAPLRPVPRPWGAVGLLTVAELLRPEPMRCLAVNGSDLIAATGRLAGPPADTATVDGVPPFDRWRVRAGENNCYLAVANATRPDGRGGGSGLHGPSHYDRQAPRVTLDACAEEAASLPLILDPATPAGRMAADKPLLAQRRPELYAGRLAI